MATQISDIQPAPRAGRAPIRRASRAAKPQTATPPAHDPPTPNHYFHPLQPTAYSLQPTAYRLQPPHRRGVLLLVCLSLLVLFAVLGITFVMVAGQYRRGSKAESRHEQHVDNYQEQLDDAFGQIVRDVSNGGSLLSAIADHSLLNDFSGTEFVEGTVGAAVTPLAVGNQIFEIPVSAPYQMSLFAGYYNGCVLTMISGKGGVRSSRIVGYRPGPDSSSGTVRVLAFEGGVVPDAGDRLIINGRPFNGAGFGYNISTGRLNAVDAGGFPLALIPHHRYATTGPMWRGADEDYDAPDTQNMLLAFMPAAPTSSDQIMPSLHRPDLINYLAVNDASPGVKFWNDTATSSFSGSPSAPLTTNGALRQRQAMLRPHPADHVFQGGGTFKFKDTGSPDLDGSGGATTGSIDFTGKEFDPVHGPWDVDNDGDGVTDSVWVDLGYPVQTAPDGRQFKPLFAVLCVDLDGRLNVNAHGSFAQIDPGADGSWNTNDDPHTMSVQDSSNTPVFAGPTLSVDPPRGLGFGPAEINLTSVFSRDEVEKLFRGDSGTGYPGRYGESAGGAVEAGVTGTASDLMRINFSGFTNDHTAATPRSMFLTPSDVWGRGAMALDLRGQPLYWKPQWSNEVLSNPYSLNLSRSVIRPTGSTASVDNPFTVAELERLLRLYDVDAASLPIRLADLPNTADPSYPGSRPNTANGLRHLLTTDSYDVPTPAPSLTREMIDNLASGSPDPAINQLAGMTGISVADYLRAKLIAGRGYNPSSLSSADVSRLNSDLAQMLDTEVLSGLRMDLNRPLGNGRDDNSNGVVDEPEECTVETILPDPPAITGYDGTVPFDHDNDGVTGSSDWDDSLARYRFARQLFILAMMLRDPAYNYPTTETLPTAPSGQPSSPQELTIRRIAQWAVNVADYRDADAIMTPFEYDVNPFDGWSVDGVVGENPGPNGIQGDSDDAHPGEDGIFGTSDDVAADFDSTNAQRRLVWGCEAPELLLTETFAMHDRRVVDSRHDDVEHKRRDEDGDNSTVDDDDLDQALIPQGSAFFELYCARNPNNPVYPAELYTEVNPGIWTLDLGRTAPADPNGNAYPVWRLAITDPVATNSDNDLETLLSSTSKPDSTAINPPQTVGATTNMSMLYGATATNLRIERIVWFSTAAPGTHVDAANTYWARGGPYGILPGHYAVVGPRTVTAFGGTETLGTPSAQVLRLNNVSMHIKPDGTSSYPVAGNDIQAPMGIVVAGDIPTNAAVPTWTNGANTANHGAGGAPGIGISISEPLYSSASYYREPDVANTNNGNKIEAYGDVNETDATKYFLDAPLDGKPGTLLETRLNTGIQPGLKRTVFLQRLANPLQPWNPEHGQAGHQHEIPVNPYITVDWMPIECLVFNGLADKPSGSAAVPWDPQDNNDNPANLPVVARERGVPRKPAGASVYNLWAPVSEPIAAVSIGKSGPTTNIFEFNLEHTLGYINQSFQNTTATTPWITSTTTPAVLARYYGDPLKPFPYITFNNRPFANPLEVLQVPASGPDRLCLELSSATSDNPYGVAATPATDYAPFRHLLNFFHDSTAAGGSPHLARILDYLRVPSPFVGTETILNPTRFNGNAAGTEGLHPPFNRVSNFREPGRININTISDQRVWTGILNGRPGPLFANVVASRRGYGANTDATIFSANNLPPSSPTVFANPFRGAGGGLRFTPGTPGATGSGATSLKEVDATLLRSGGTVNNDGNPLFKQNHTELYRDSTRNSQFYYEELQRVSGLVTTRSNVYAIWITMGYFEVTPVTGTYNTTVYPDGYRLSQELGADTGEITRHRAFYIYDRTIPVGYQRGKDLNIEQGILLRRMIE